MTDPILEALKKYFDTCPFMAGGRLHGEALPEQGLAWSLGEEPERSTVRRYFRGRLRQCTYTLCVEERGKAGLQRALAGEVCRELTGWIRQQAKERRLPQLLPGMDTQSVAIWAAKPLPDAGGEADKFKLLCRIVYFETEQEDVKQ